MIANIHTHAIESDSEPSSLFRTAGKVVLDELAACMTWRWRPRDDFEDSALTVRQETDPNLIGLAQLLRGDIVTVKVAPSKLHLLVFR